MLALAGCGGTEPIEEGRSVPRGDWRKPVGAAITADPLRDDDAYRRAFFSTFSSATPENELKWEFTEPSRGRYTFEAGDAVVDAARRAGARVRGHALMWDLQLPDWIGKAKQEELEGILREHVRAVATHYRGRVAQWDAVNEPLNDDGTALERNVFERAMGEGYIDLVFEEARKADPDAKLFLNEIAAERGPKADALVALAQRLRKRGVPIDGIGIQNHAKASDFPSEQELASLMRRLRPLDVEITEMDVVGDADPVPAWRAAAEACAEAPNCTGLTVWGVDDEHSWQGPEKAPTVFDAEARPKAGLRAIRDALGRG